MDEKIESFDPNDLGKDAPKWATFIPLRSGGSFKFHFKRAQALAAFNSWNQASLWELVDGKWVKRAAKTFEDRPETCDHCGGSTTSQRDGGNWGRWVFEKRNGRITDALNLRFLCEDCRLHLS